MSDRASARAAELLAPREDRLDVVAAALVGILIGATATLLTRRSRPQPMLTRVRKAAAGGAERLASAANDADRRARRLARSGAKAARRAPSPADVGEHMADYLADARESINDAVQDELQQLRKAVRRQRKRLGV